MFEDHQLPEMLLPYDSVLKILHKNAITKDGKKKEISHEIMHSLYINRTRYPKSS